MEDNCWASLIQTTTDDVKRLTAVVRYSSIPVAVYENVAEHSFWVSLYSVMIAKTLGADRDVQGQVALFGTLHDLAECVTGDVVRPFKYSSQEFKEAVDRAEASMIGELPPEVSSLMSDMDEIRSEYIRAIVKAADWLSVYQYMRREASRGNLEIIPFFMRMVKDLESAVKENEGKKVSLHAGADDFIPANFYHTLWSHALLVADDCFGDLAKPESRWMREV
jgi:5'-deoxynucleotidase YfbR-like HD superfamily hydrolase